MGRGGAAAVGRGLENGTVILQEEDKNRGQGRGGGTRESGWKGSQGFDYKVCIHIIGFFLRRRQSQWHNIERLSFLF